MARRLWQRRTNGRKGQERKGDGFESSFVFGFFCNSISSKGVK